MAQQIHLAAIVDREGKLLLHRRGEGAWELPGGAFLPEHEDVDAGMAAILGGLGIEVPAIEEAFVETIYLPAEEGHTVYNLYATARWSGEPAAPEGMAASWHEPAALSALPMEDRVRQAVLTAYGLRTPVDDTHEILAALQGGAPEAQAGQVPAGDRRAAGLDVMRTLQASDPVARHEALRQRAPELADDVIDFAMGEVWATPRLDRRTRSLEVVAMLAALAGRPSALRSHINGALNHGATPDEVVETLRMVAVYAGFPAALEAWPVMEEVFAARDIPRPERGP